MPKSEPTLEQRYLKALRRLRVYADHLEELAKWREDITSRLWRASIILHIGGEALDDMAALEKEIERFRAAADAIGEKNGDV